MLTWGGNRFAGKKDPVDVGPIFDLILDNFWLAARSKLYLLFSGETGVRTWVLSADVAADDSIMVLLEVSLCLERLSAPQTLVGRRCVAPIQMFPG